MKHIKKLQSLLPDDITLESEIEGDINADEFAAALGILHAYILYYHINGKDSRFWFTFSFLSKRYMLDLGLVHIQYNGKNIIYLKENKQDKLNGLISLCFCGNHLVKKYLKERLI